MGMKQLHDFKVTVLSGKMKSSDPIRLYQLRPRLWFLLAVG